MNREQFLAQLKESLGSMPETKKQDILYDYEEHFSVGLSEGKTEEEIAESLGDPRVIGNSYRIEALLEHPKGGDSANTRSVLLAVFASISLTFLNLVFVLGPFLGLLGVLFAMWAVASAIIFTGLAVIVAPFVPDKTQFIANPLLNGAFMVFSGISIAALGALASIGMLVLTKWFFKGVAAYVMFNARLMRGEKLGGS